jgi:formate/nitrite transporter FocA (FNT family)
MSAATDDPPVDVTPEQQAEQKHEDQIVEEKTAVGSHIVYKAILKEADEELGRSTAALAWSGLAAGLSMGFSLVAEGLLRSHLPDTPWRPLISKLGYSLGFLIVILGRQQLFTENTLTPMLPLMQRKDAGTFRNVARLWSVVLPTNLIGAVAFAFLLQRTNAFDPKVKAEFLNIGQAATHPSFWGLMIKGVFAGWLIALMVWLLPVAESGRIAVIVIITYVVGLGELSHVIAGSVEAIYTVAAGKHSCWDFFARYFVPTLLGNCFGGVALVAALNHAQVKAGVEDSKIS